MQGIIRVGAAVLTMGVMVPAAMVSGARANPVYTLTLQDSGGTVVKTDNGTGSISYSGTLGGFTISSMNVSDLNLTNALDVAFGSQDIFSASGKDTLSVFVTVSNLPAFVPTMLTVGTTSQANFQGKYIMGWSSKTYYDPGDHTGTAGLVQLLSSTSGGIVHNGFLESTAGLTDLTGSPFSYTVEYTLHLATNQYANGAGASTNVILPEPRSALILGMGLAGLGVSRLRRKPLRTGAIHRGRCVPVDG